MRTHTSRSAVRKLALARLISITGGAAAFAALNFTVYERTGSAAWLSASMLLTFGVAGVYWAKHLDTAASRSTTRMRFIE